MAGVADLRAGLTRAAPPPYRPPEAWAVRFFTWYFRRIIRRDFAGAWLGAASDPAAWDRAVPTLFVANHTNWWDGFVTFLVGGRLGITWHILMEAENLARYAVFRRFGTLPMRRGRPRQAVADLEAGAACLRPGTSLWIFPQGGRRPALAPLGLLERGAAHLVARHPGPLRVVPVALRYPFLGEQRPEIFVWVDEPWYPEPGAARARDAVHAELGQRLEAALTALDGRLRTESLDAFSALAPGRLSVNKRLDRARHAVGLLDGPFEPRNG